MTIDNLPKLLAGAGLAAAFFHRDFLAENWTTVAAIPLSMLMGEVSTRIFCFAKSYTQISNLKEKYSIASFFNKTEKAALLVLTPLSVGYAATYWNDCKSILLPCTLAHFLIRIYARPPPIVIKQQFGRELNGIYYGPAMAYSYFYGYFKIILFPNSADAGKSFSDKITAYIDRYQNDEGRKINVPDKRLQILIPLSGECTRDLKDKADGWIRSTKISAEVETDRGGVKERKYHNTMYQIKKPDSKETPVYVNAEYATPIITYLEACRQSGETDLALYKIETVRSFYETLKRLVDQESCIKDNVNLILYEDKDESGKPFNIAHMLVKIITKSN